MKTSNKRPGTILFLSISLSIISLGLTSCSNDDKTTSMENKVETIATETLNTKTVSTETLSTESIGTEKTASPIAMNKTEKQPSDDMLTHGEEAHKIHCYKCHTDTIYTREDRFVKSIDALSKQVLRCKEGNDVPWFDEDSDAVVQFLNQKYYRF
jgi:hypothetical protein